MKILKKLIFIQLSIVIIATLMFCISANAADENFTGYSEDFGVWTADEEMFLGHDGMTQDTFGKDLEDISPELGEVLLRDLINRDSFREIDKTWKKVNRKTVSE